MVGKKQNMGSMWNILRKESDLGDPTPSIDQVYLGCSEREAKVDLQAIQSKTELFKKITTTREAEEKHQTKGTYSLEKITARRHDMEGHAEKCLDGCCELAKKDVSCLQQVQHRAKTIAKYYRRLWNNRRALCGMCSNISAMLVFGKNWTTSFIMVSIYSGAAILSCWNQIEDGKLGLFQDA